MANIFQNPMKNVPKNDSQIVVVDMDKSDIGGRKSHMPPSGKSDILSVKHIPSEGSKG